MGIRFTTGWAQKLEKPWEEWVSSLTSGTRVLVQEFIVRGNFCLDSQYECWRFWVGIVHKNRVFYNNQNHPYKDGFLVYWNSDSPQGDVFPTRVVPFHNDCYEAGWRFVDGHAPIYEPAWGLRHFVFVPYGENHHKTITGIKKMFEHSYHIEVNGGVLITVFGEDVDKLPESPNYRYLYSEDLRG